MRSNRWPSTSTRAAGPVLRRLGKEVRFGIMPGQIRALLDQIIRQRSKGNPTLVATTTTKIMLKGINPGKFDAGSPDDPVIISRVRVIATELGVRL